MLLQRSKKSQILNLARKNFTPLDLKSNENKLGCFFSMPVISYFSLDNSNDKNNYLIFKNYFKINKYYLYKITYLIARIKINRKKGRRELKSQLPSRRVGKYCIVKNYKIKRKRRAREDSQNYWEYQTLIF